MKKFIITHDGHFRYGNVRMHKDLLEPHDMCIGGGFYEFDYVSARLLLSGRSYDFGSPQWHYIDTLLLPAELRGLQIEYEGRDLRDFLKLTYI